MIQRQVRLCRWTVAVLLTVSSLVLAQDETATEGATDAESASVATPSYAGKMIVVIGAGGTDEYSKTFTEWSENWSLAAKQAGYDFRLLGSDVESEDNDRDQLKQEIEQSIVGQSIVGQSTPLWIVLIGHGTSDRNVTKFNLRGKDVSGEDLKAWLAPCERPLILVNSFSSSGALINELSGDGRVIITATNSGAEMNYSRFGGQLSAAISDAEADLDHDGQVSLLEAYLLASSRVARFYESEARLATEHSLLEDNHDGKGTPAEFFTGIRVETRAKDGSLPDGSVAHRYILVPSKDAVRLTPEQTAERDRLETEIDLLRQKKKQLSTDQYYEKLEELMLQMAQLYDAT